MLLPAIPLVWLAATTLVVAACRAAARAEAKGIKVGDKVMGSGGAAFAEYALADHGRLFRTPSNMNFEEAATLPVALATMHNAVVTNGATKLAFRRVAA